MREILLFCVCLLTTFAHACINLTQRVPGVLIEDVEFYRLGSVEIDNDSLQAYIRKTSASCGNKLSRECNDLVIAHLFAKDFKAAVGLSTRLVAKYPNDYSVVITHAAALELNGKPGDAIPFMKRALELDPRSHKGSEWIHLNILQQRVLGEAGVDPSKLIGVDLRPEGVLKAPTGTNVKDLLLQIHYQVNDRLFFTPKQDRLFGALMLAYADLLELNGYRTQAVRMRERSTGYGFVHSKDTDIGERPSLAEQEATKQDSSANLNGGSPIATDTSGDQFLQEKVQEDTKVDSNASLYSWLLIGAMVAGAGLFIWRNSRTA